MGDAVVLSWRRERGSGRAHVFVTGEIRYTEPAPVCTFENTSFEQMMRMFASVLQRHPNAGGAMQRLDRPGLPAHPLDEVTVGLLRTDPEQVIHSMQVVVHAPLDTPRSQLPPILMVGQDAVADAFGTRLYCRRRRQEIECPVCGRWRPHAVEAARHVDVVCCKDCGVSIAVALHNERWASVRAQELLESNAPRFFFPRAWNEGRNWISHKALKQKYDQFVQESAS